MKRLYLVVGPNGAGKTAFVEDRLAPLLPGLPFVNADVIARRTWPDDPEGHSYQAAREASRIRSKLVASGESFLAETVFSHPSKLEVIRDATKAGYRVALHVMMVPVDLSVARVAVRVAEGGHSVPELKIRERFDRLWPLVAQAIALADDATVYDNSASDRTRVVARFAGGIVVERRAWPSWAPEVLTSLG